MNVTVLLSTYNGEQFIEEQIESIMNQTFPGMIQILVRDDGSKDETVGKLKGFSQSENRIIKVIEGDNVGPQKSFLQLMEMADSADYYFFADQDDIWYQEKIETAIDQMEKVEGPVCYCSNYDVFNSMSGEQKEQLLKESPQFRPLRIILYNQIPGCTIGFNESLMYRIKQIHLDNCMMHDSLVLALAACCGEIIYDPLSRIAHRIHGLNVIGEGHKKIVPLKWLKAKIELLNNKEPYDLSEMANRFIETNCVKKEFLNDMCLLRDYKKSWSNTHRLLLHPDTMDKTFDRTTMSIRSKIRFHLF